MVATHTFPLGGPGQGITERTLTLDASTNTRSLSTVGAHLETSARVRVVVFDRTGTLTSGRFRVARVVAFVLRAAAAVEQGSERRLAAAIVAHARALTCRCRRSRPWPR